VLNCSASDIRNQVYKLKRELIIKLRGELKQFVLDKPFETVSATSRTTKAKHSLQPVRECSTVEALNTVIADLKTTLEEQCQQNLKLVNDSKCMRSERKVLVRRVIC